MGLGRDEASGVEGLSQHGRQGPISHLRLEAGVGFFCGRGGGD